MNSILRYVASGSKGTLHSLATEILSLTGSKPKLFPELDSLEFTANQKQLLQICFKSHLIENLKVQIGNKFTATDEKELMTGLKKLPLHAFINKEIKINCTIAAHNSKLKTTRASVMLQRYLADNNISSSINFGNHFSNQPQKAGLIPSINGLLQLSLSDRFGRLYTPVNKTTMYKHGWKTNVNYAPLRQSLAASILCDTGIITKAKKSRSLKLWDPFCGSGTFILEALSLYLNLPVRDSDGWMACTDWPCFDNSLFENYKLSLGQKQQSYGDISLLGSDIDVQTINSTLQNYQHFKSQLQGQNDKIPFVKRSPTHKIYTSSINELYFAAQDFQTVSKQILTGHGMTIVTNLPFGHRSRQKTSKNQLLSAYKRFDKLVKTQRNRFQNVFILLPTLSEASENHFISVSEQKWKLKNCYQSGGKQIGLYQIENNNSISLISNNMQPMELKDLALTIPENKQLALNVIERSNKQMKVNTDLPKHLIPRTPKRGKQRVQWRRQVHRKKEDFKEHALMRSERQEVKQFQSEKIKERKVQRGVAWKQMNVQTLGQERIKSEKYKDKISNLFENKVKQAIEASDKDKQFKRNKRLRNKGESTHVRKW